MGGRVGLPEQPKQHNNSVTRSQKRAKLKEKQSNNNPSEGKDYHEARGQKRGSGDWASWGISQTNRKACEWGWKTGELVMTIENANAAKGGKTLT